MNSRLTFYQNVVLKHLDKKFKILIVGAGLNDYQVFEKLGYSNVILSNYNGTKIDKINFKQIDINKINEKDESYDYVVAHACIHHCSKPHSGILELYRVAKKGVLVIESKDSFLMKLMILFKIAEKYELSAINPEDEFGDCGGVDNTKIPNFVYRWTEREVEKLINSFEPRFKHVIKFDYKFDFENIENKFSQKYVKKIIKFILFYLIKILDVTVKKQANLFAFFIDKEKSNKQKFLWID